jgi:methionyl-tRNA formyltransferase
MRVVVISQYVTAVRGIVRVCRARGHDPVAVLSARTVSGRGGRPSPEMVGQVKAIVGATPPGIDLAVVSDVDRLEALVAFHRPDLLLVRGFRWRLPASLLAVPGHGAVNLHPSFLPKLRGPFPVHWAIRNGDRTLGVTAHRMDADFDTGPVLAAARVDVAQEEFGPEIWRRVDKGAEQAVDMALDQVVRGNEGEPQVAADATYAGPFTADDAVIDWARPAASIHNLVRAWSLGSPGPDGPIAELHGERVRLHRTSMTAVDAPRVECGDGPIWLVDHTPA